MGSSKGQRRSKVSKGAIKTKIFDGDDKDPKGKKFKLDDYEFRFIKDMNTALAFHTLRNQLISAFLTYVAKEKFGYTSIRDGYMLAYEVDPRGDDHTLIIKEVPKPKED